VIVKPVHVNRFKRDNSPSPLVIPQKDQSNANINQQPQHQYRSSETLYIPTIGGSSNTLLLPDIDTSNLTTSPVSDTSSDKFALPTDPTLTILLFPGTADWRNQSLYEKFMNILTLPLYLMFTLTVPVMVQTVEEELKSEISSLPGISEFPIFVTPASPSMQGSAFVASPISITHNKNIAERQLKIVQAFFVTIFFFEIMLVQTGLVSRSLWWAPVLVGLALSYSLHLLYKKYPLINQRVLTALIGFFQSITWISIIATSVVDILSSLGLILQISEEVIGLTVFAFGNSLGDFISNVAVARMGYPMMAISACFAGPMLNMMLGIGLSGAILIPSQGDHIKLTVSNTTLLSGFGVLATLLAFNIYLPLNKYRIGKKFGFSLIIFYCTTMFALILITFLKFEA
jgi:sodium/potassium/calcium exchanger 6